MGCKSLLITPGQLSKLIAHLQRYAESLGSSFAMHKAFSREQKEKVYVQHLLKQQADEVNDLLENHKANVYVCGDAANMARDVNTVLSQIISEKRGLSIGKAEDIVKGMRSRGTYQEDVWS